MAAQKSFDGSRTTGTIHPVHGGLGNIRRNHANRQQRIKSGKVHFQVRVLQVTKAMANEWALQNVNVNCILPGYISTELTTALMNDQDRCRQLFERIPQRRFGEPEDLVGAVVFLASAASNYVNGVGLAVDGGWLAR